MAITMNIIVEQIINLNNKKLGIMKAQFYVQSDYFIMNHFGGIKDEKSMRYKLRGLPSDPYLSHGARNLYYVPVLKQNEIEKIFPKIANLKDPSAIEDCFLGMTAVHNNDRGFLCESLAKDLKKFSFEDKPGKEYVEKNKWHHTSWLTLDEAKTVREDIADKIKRKSKLKNNHEYDIGQLKEIDSILLYMWALESTVKDRSRMLFWFVGE